MQGELFTVVLKKTAFLILLFSFHPPVHYVFFKVFLGARIGNVRIIRVKHWKEIKLSWFLVKSAISGEILLDSLYRLLNCKHALWPRQRNKSRKVAVQKWGGAYLQICFIKLGGDIAISTLFMTPATNLLKELEVKEADFVAKNMFLAFNLNNDSTNLIEIVFKVKISRR